MADPSHEVPRDPSAGPEPSLGHQVRVGLGWSMVNTLVNRLWTVALGLVLARLLVPEDYGIFAIGLVTLNVMQSMNELGVSLAVVQWQGDPGVPARTALTMSLVSSAVFYAGAYAAAPAVAAALRTPEATDLLRVLTLGVLLDGISSIPNAFLTRLLLQGRRTIADTAALVASTVVTLTLAVQGAGAWSLVWGSLAGNLVATVLIWVLSPVRTRPGFDLADARRLLAFGIPLAGSSFLMFAMLNVDYLVVGRLLGPVALGFYVLAFNLSSWPTNLLSFSIRRVSIAGFARLAGDPERLRERFAGSFATLVTVVVPMVVVVAVLASPMVRVLYGERWAPSIGPLRYLVLLGGARVAFDLCYDLLVATGRARAILFVQGWWLVVLVPALVVGGRMDGTRGVALAHVVVAVVAVTPAFAIALSRLGLRPSRLARPLARPLAAGVLAAGAAMAAAGAVEGKVLDLLVGGAAALAVYLPAAVPLRQLTRRLRSWSAGRRAPAPDVAVSE